MRGKEFRCHPSIIVANSLRVIIVAAVAMLSSLPEDILAEDGSLDIGAASLTALITFGVILAALIIYLVTRFFAWKRTYISVTNENFIYDKRTVFFQKKVNVKLLQISTVNFQKGIVDRIFGTYTVKLDIDSSATAEKTDFHLVFKEDLAKAFEAEILSAKGEHATSANDNSCTASPIQELAPIISFDTGRILLHSLFMTPIWGAIAFGAALAGVSVPFMELSPIFYPIVFLLGLPVALILSFLSSLLRNVFLYHNFTLSKNQNELVISFGLITKRTFRLPLSKTNAVIVKQSFFGRIFGMYYAEIINVGMGNEQERLSPVFCLMLKKQALERVLEEAVPEFAGEIKFLASPARAFLPTFLKGALPMLALIAVTVVFGIAIEKPVVMGIAVMVLILLWIAIAFFSYRAKGLMVDKEKLIIATGVLARRIIIVPFAKVQMLTVKRGPVCAPLGLRCGSVSVLSAMANQNNYIGYFEPHMFNSISKKIEQNESVDWRI